MITGNKKKCFPFSIFSIHIKHTFLCVYKCYSSSLLSPLSSFFMSFINLSLCTLRFIKRHQLRTTATTKNHKPFTTLQLCLYYHLQLNQSNQDILNANAKVCFWNNRNLKGRENIPVWCHHSRCNEKPRTQWRLGQCTIKQAETKATHKPKPIR